MKEFEELTPERKVELKDRLLSVFQPTVDLLSEQNSHGFTVAQLRDQLEQQHGIPRGFLSSQMAVGNLYMEITAGRLQKLEKKEGEGVYRYLRPVQAEPAVPPPVDSGEVPGAQAEEETDDDIAPATRKPRKQPRGGIGDDEATTNTVGAIIVKAQNGGSKLPPLAEKPSIELPKRKEQRHMADKKKRRQEGSVKNGGDDPVDRRIKWLMRLSFLIQEAVERGEVSEEALKVYTHYDPVFKHDVARAQYEKERASFEKRSTAIEAVYYNFIETSDEAATEVFKLVRRASDATLLGFCSNDVAILKAWRVRNANQWQDQPPRDVMSLIKILKAVRPAPKKSELDLAAIEAVLETATQPQDVAKQPSTEPSPNKEKDVSDATEPGQPGETGVNQPPDPAGKPAAAEADKAEEATATDGTQTPPGSTSNKPSLVEEIRFAGELADTKDDLNEARLELEAANTALTTAVEEKKKLEGQVTYEQGKYAKLNQAHRRFVEDCIMLGLQPEDWVSQVRKLKKVQADLAAAQAAANEHEQCAARFAEHEGKLKKAETELTEERSERAASDVRNDEQVAKLREEIGRLTASPTNPPNGGGKPMAESQLKASPVKVSQALQLQYELNKTWNVPRNAEQLAGFSPQEIGEYIASLQEKVDRQKAEAETARTKLLKAEAPATASHVGVVGSPAAVSPPPGVTRLPDAVAEPSGYGTFFRDHWVKGAGLLVAILLAWGAYMAWGASQTGNPALEEIRKHYQDQPAN